jgi:MFS family permease
MWAAMASSSIGDGLFFVALPLLALQYTRSPLAISGIVIAGQVPGILVALPIGTLADRLNRRRMILTIQAARFAILAAFAVITLSGAGSLALIYVTAFALGGLNISFDVVGNSSLPFLVRSENLVQANAHLLNADMTAENMVGPALGGVAFAAARSLPFIADALSLAGAALLLRGAVPDTTPEPTASTAWEDLREGTRWFVGQPLLRQLTAVIGSLAFCQGMVLGLLVLYAKEQLHLSSAGYGFLLAVASIGTVIGGLIARRVHDRLGSGGTIIASAVAFGIAYPVMAITHSARLACTFLFLQEMAVIVGNTASRSLRQRIVPSELQGRAASANSMVIMSCVPLGGLVGGTIAAASGLTATFTTAGIIQGALLVLSGPKLVARIRRLERQGVRAGVVDLTERVNEVLAGTDDLELVEAG